MEPHNVDPLALRSVAIFNPTKKVNSSREMPEALELITAPLWSRFEHLGFSSGTSKFAASAMIHSVGVDGEVFIFSICAQEPVSYEWTITVDRMPGSGSGSSDCRPRRSETLRPRVGCSSPSTRASALIRTFRRSVGTRRRPSATGISRAPPIHHSDACARPASLVLSTPTMKPHVICHMMVSLDGRIHPSRWTASPEGNVKDWAKVYEDVHGTLAGDAWLVGRVTMAEMSKGTTHPPASPGKVARPHHFAKRDAGTYAIAFDRSGKLHFAKPDIGGDHVVVLLGPGVPDAHLAELAGDGVSYVVAPDEEMAARPLFELLGRELGIKRLLVEGGGNVNGSLLAAGVVDEISLLVAPAIDGALGITGVFEVPEAAGLAGKVRLRFVGSEALGSGVVRLRYGVEAG